MQKLKTTIRFHYRPLALFMFSFNSGLVSYGQEFELKLVLKQENMKKLQQVQDYLASLQLICILGKHIYMIDIGHHFVDNIHNYF